jgi:hypothetical protein
VAQKQTEISSLCIPSRKSRDVSVHFRSGAGRACMSLRGVTQLGDVLPHAALFISESIIARERRSGVLRPKTRLSNYQLGQALARFRACWLC